MAAVPWLVVSASQIAGDSQSRSDSPTFNADIAPILRAKCLTCHRRDGDAPVPLETINQVRRRASLIVQLTASGYMPPWKPAPDSPEYRGERRLSAAEKDLFRQWVANGMPEGESSALSTEQAVENAGWIWGPPDLVLSLPEYVLAAGTSDVFRNFVVRVPYVGTRYVRGFQLRPRSRAVHHSNIRIDSTTASSELDVADPAPGYEGLILHSARYPPGQFLGWTPGQAAPPDNRMAWQLDGGSDFVVQLHMRSTGQTDRIQPLLGLYFGSEPPSQRSAMIRLGRQDLRMRAGDRHYVSVDTFAAPVPITVIALQPHSHYRARDVLLKALLPGGSEQTLLHIADWDFYWQDQYRLARPIRLPAGTTLRSTFTFDNSEHNLRNPSHPPQEASWGWRTADEMADVWVQVETDTVDAQKQLTRLAQRRAAEEDAIGAEILVAREPSHFNLRNDAASIYQELGQPEDALRHFEAARRLKPNIASPAFNVGTALESLGRESDATSAYRSAISIDSSYLRARARLAALLFRQGQLAAALQEYTQALKLKPGDDSLRCERARVLVAVDKPGEARTEYAAALSRNPGDFVCLVNATWLLAAHEDEAIRSPVDAVKYGELAVSLSPSNDTRSAAFDALGAALAAAGRFTEAVQAAEQALRLSGPQPVRDIKQRLQLYQRKLPFRVSP